MFDLDSAILRWRNDFALDDAFTKSDLDELEDHLRTAFQDDVDDGTEPILAFENARNDIGAIAELSSEFGKVKSGVWRKFLTAGWAMFVLAFFLPVHSGGITLAVADWDVGALPGFEALYYGITGELGLMGFLSALTNVLMGLSVCGWAIRKRQNVFVLAGCLAAAVFLNLYWLTDGLHDLRLGYFVWWASFASVAAGCIIRARELPERPTLVPVT